MTEQKGSGKVSKINLQRAKPTRLFEQAVEQIKALIIQGTLKPGDKLPSESKLGQMLDVSRSSIREALRALESKGLIEVRSGAGAFVADRPFSLSSVNEAVEWLLKEQDSLLQVLQVREVIEGLSALLAASSITHDELVELAEIIKQQDEILRVGANSTFVEELAQLDTDFHLVISQASRNEIVDQLVKAIVPSFYESNKAILFVEKRGPKLLEEHQAILNALQNRNAISAEQSMRSHIARVASEVHDLKHDDRKTIRER